MAQQPHGGPDERIPPTLPFEPAADFDDTQRTQPLDTSAGSAPGGTQRAIAGQRFGDYELLEEIARGGMGVVYKARHTKLNRIVALKMILAGQFANPEEVRRFHAEAEAAAQLDHPGIVPVHEVGEHQGQPFFSMGFVDGPSLASRLDDGPLPPREAAELVRQVAEAVAYAHERGIVHRDLKPGNILLQSTVRGAGSTELNSDRSALPSPNSLLPKITDFGLAKRVSENTGLTATGQILGTPSYMAPEQARGQHDQVGPRSDVYALGAILYACMTGRPPFLAPTVWETLQQVADQQPVSPQELNNAIPNAAAAIVLKCLEKQPSKRYGSAIELAVDLSRFLAGEPTKAKRNSRMSSRWLIVVGLAMVGISMIEIFGTIWGCIYMYSVSLDPTSSAELRREFQTNSMYMGASAVYCLVLLFGAFAMVRRNSYFWALVTCCLAVLPCSGPSCVLLVPFGIWGITLLCRRHIRDSFKAT